VIVFATLACLSTKQPLWTAAVAWCERLVSNSSDALPLRCVTLRYVALRYVTLRYVTIAPKHHKIRLMFRSVKLMW